MKLYESITSSHILIGMLAQFFVQILYEKKSTFGSKVYQHENFHYSFSNSQRHAQQSLIIRIHLLRLFHKFIQNIHIDPTSIHSPHTARIARGTHIFSLCSFIIFSHVTYQHTLLPHRRGSTGRSCYNV